MIDLHYLILEQGTVSLMILIYVIALYILVSLSFIGDVNHGENFFNVVILVHVVTSVFYDTSVIHYAVGYLVINAFNLPVFLV